MNAWCFLASVVALADGFDLDNFLDLFLAIVGFGAALVLPPVAALVLAIIIWGKVSLDRPLMPMVAAGTLALCILAI